MHTGRCAEPVSGQAVAGLRLPKPLGPLGLLEPGTGPELWEMSELQVEEGRLRHWPRRLRGKRMPERKAVVGEVVPVARSRRPTDG